MYLKYLCSNKKNLISLLQVFLDSFELKDLNKNNFEELIEEAFKIRMAEVKNFRQFYQIMKNLDTVLKGTNCYNKSKKIGLILINLQLIYLLFLLV